MAIRQESQTKSGNLQSHDLKTNGQTTHMNIFGVYGCSASPKLSQHSPIGSRPVPVSKGAARAKQQSRAIAASTRSICNNKSNSVWLAVVLRMPKVSLQCSLQRQQSLDQKAFFATIRFRKDIYLRNIQSAESQGRRADRQGPRARPRCLWAIFG